MKWIRLSEQKPPINTDILILVDGRIHEGYLHSLLLMGKTEPTEFHTTYLTNYEHAQHGYWGDDPYWMPIPCEKPEQIPTKKRTFFETKEEK
jgi:hypothetical protein